MSEFFAMGGYAYYVWMSVAVTAVVLVWNIFAPIIRRKTLLRDVAGQIARTNRNNTENQ